MGIDWESILDSDGDDIASDYESLVHNAGSQVFDDDDEQV